MRKILIGFTIGVMLVGCGQSYEETKRISKAERIRLAREDAAALKIGVMPTLDCLPVFLAKDHQMFDTVVDIRLKRFTAQMDCDTALQRKRVEGSVTDLVRAERLIGQGTALTYFAPTNAYWLMVGNRHSRITQLKHLDDKMLAMTRYSVTDLMGDLAVDSAKLKTERVFRIQVNDVGIRLKMLENNEMDALLLTEPQATQALLMKHKVLLDSRKEGLHMGVIAFRTAAVNDSKRQQQMEVFKKGYNAACDSINKYGVRHYKDVLRRHYGLTDKVIAQLPDSLHFPLAAAPDEKDIERARKWLSKK